MKNRQHRGYFISGPEIERDTLTCGHCQRVVMIAPGNGASTPVPFCRTCMRYICPTCDARAVCTPWEMRLKAVEARAQMLRAIGVAS